MKCCTCGTDLGFDDDPYADPDCPYCLQESIEAELMAEVMIEEEARAEIEAMADQEDCANYDEYDACKVPLWASDFHDE